MTQDRMHTEDPTPWVPHRPPMLLLTGCKPGAAGEEVEAWVDITPDSPFFDAEGGGVPGCVALEYMAQAMAVYVGRVRAAAGLAPAVGFVLGTRRMSVDIPFFASGSRYAVRSSCTYRDDAFGSFDCRIEDAEGAVVATAQVTAYLAEGMLPDQLEESE